MRAQKVSGKCPERPTGHSPEKCPTWTGHFYATTTKLITSYFGQSVRTLTLNCPSQIRTTLSLSIESVCPDVRSTKQEFSIHERTCSIQEANHVPGHSQLGGWGRVDACAFVDRELAASYVSGRQANFSNWPSVGASVDARQSPDTEAREAAGAGAIRGHGAEQTNRHQHPTCCNERPYNRSRQFAAYFLASLRSRSRSQAGAKLLTTNTL